MRRTRARQHYRGAAARRLRPRSGRGRPRTRSRRTRAPAHRPRAPPPTRYEDRPARSTRPAGNRRRTTCRAHSRCLPGRTRWASRCGPGSCRSCPAGEAPIAGETARNASTPTSAMKGRIARAGAEPPRRARMRLPRGRCRSCLFVCRVVIVDLLGCVASSPGQAARSRPRLRFVQSLSPRASSCSSDRAGCSPSRSPRTSGEEPYLSRLGDVSSG